MPARNLVTSPASSNVPCDGIFEPARRGKSAIKRAAIVPCSRCGKGASGSAAIDKANLLVAASRGNRANSAASCQGSISNRASAESTLSGMSFLSSPIGANRKLSNSDPSTEAKAEWVISITDLRRTYRTRSMAEPMPVTFEQMQIFSLSRRTAHRHGTRNIHSILMDLRQSLFDLFNINSLASGVSIRLQSLDCFV
jgi:hypothetical protein